MALIMCNADMEFPNWEERLEFALSVDSGFELDDESNAQSWARCAVGERDSKLLNLIEEEYTTSHVSMLLNPEIIKLGNKFAIAIARNQKERAMELYRKIRCVPMNNFYRKNVQMKKSHVELMTSTIGRLGMRQPLC